MIYGDIDAIASVEWGRAVSQLRYPNRNQARSAYNKSYIGDCLIYLFSARIPCGLAPGMNYRLSFK